MPQQLSSLPLVQAFLLFIATWLLYKLIAPLVIRSPLHNIPGPPAQSFVKGHAVDANSLVVISDADLL